jgi:HNH endonuclease
LLKPQVNEYGYHCCKVCIYGRVKTCKVHRLVAAAFLGKSRLYVNHIDGNPRNNRIENLEYATQTENVRHAINVLGKRWGGGHVTKGEQHYAAKVTDAQVIKIRELLKQGIRQNVIAHQFGLRPQTISGIRLNRKRREPGAELPSQTRGENHYNAKLSDQDITDIRQLIAKNIARKEIAERYSISVATVGNIKASRHRFKESDPEQH